MNTSTDFKQALNKFVDEAQALCDEYMAKNFPTLAPVVLKVDLGRRYVRIWKGSLVDGMGCNFHAYAFVDSTNGDILKPATWRAPAKHARGNIFKGTASDSVTQYGAKYLA